MKKQASTNSTAGAPPFHRRLDARIIMSADEAALIRLWKEKRGEAEPEDLSGDIVVQLGVAAEALNQTWYERNTGRAVTDAQRWVRHPVHRYLAATLDGFVNDLDAVFEAKFMLPWSFSEEAAAEKHMAQLRHNMSVADTRSSATTRRSAAVHKKRRPKSARASANILILRSSRDAKAKSPDDLPPCL